MYYEEKVIKGVLHFRTSPNGSWREKVIRYFICKYLSGSGMWTFDVSTFTSSKEDTLRLTEDWYGEDWFMDDNFKVVEIKIEEMLNC